MLSLFGTLDFQEINKENQNQSLIPQFNAKTYRRDPQKMQVGRKGKELQNEYFSYQLLTALGLPTPKADLVEIIEEGQPIVYINSVRLDDLGEITLNKSQQVYQTELGQYRIHPSMLTSFIAEMIILDKDNLQSLTVEKNQRLYRVTIDKELTFPEFLPDISKKSKIADMYRSFKDRVNKHGVFPSTEQELAQLDRLTNILKGDPSPLRQIFYNSRVEATPQLNTPYRDQLYHTWLRNIVTIITYMRKKHANSIKGFKKREAIRTAFADYLIRKKLKIPENIDINEYRKQLIDDLRGRLYYQNQESGKVFSNFVVTARIIKIEQERLEQLSLHSRIDEILALKYEENKHFLKRDFFNYQKKQFLSNTQWIKAQDVKTIIAGFTKHIDHEIRLAAEQEEATKPLTCRLEKLSQQLSGLIAQEKYEAVKKYLIMEINLEKQKTSDDFQLHSEPTMKERVYMEAREFIKTLPTLAKDAILKCGLNTDFNEKLQYDLQPYLKEFAAAGITYREQVITLRAKEFSQHIYWSSKMLNGLFPTFVDHCGKKDLLACEPNKLLLKSAGIPNEEPDKTFFYQITTDKLEIQQASDFLKSIFQHYGKKFDQEQYIPEVSIIEKDFIKITFPTIEARKLFLEKIALDSYSPRKRQVLSFYGVKKGYLYDRQQALVKEINAEMAKEQLQQELLKEGSPKKAVFFHSEIPNKISF